MPKTDQTTIPGSDEEPRNPETAAIEVALEQVLADLTQRAIKHRRKRTRQLALVDGDLDPQLHRVAKDEELATRARLAQLLSAAANAEAKSCRAEVIMRMETHGASQIVTASLEDTGSRTMSLRRSVKLKVDRPNDSE